MEGQGEKRRTFPRAKALVCLLKIKIKNSNDPVVVVRAVRTRKKWRSHGTGG